MEKMGDTNQEDGIPPNAVTPNVPNITFHKIIMKAFCFRGISTIQETLKIYELLL